MRQAEAAADHSAVPEQRSHVLRSCARRNIEVLGLSAEQEVANAASHEVGLIPASLQPPNDLGGIGVDPGLVERDRVADEPGAGVAVARVASSDASMAHALSRFDAEGGELGRSRQMIVCST